MWSIIVNIAGIVGCLLSLINFGYFFIIRRKKLTLRIEEYGVRDYFQNQSLVLIKYQIDNNSQLPISITRMQLLINGNKYDCSYSDHMVVEYTRMSGRETIERKTTYNDKLPINLNSLGSTAGYLVFPIPQDSLSSGQTALTFQICTNRGRAVQNKIALYEDVIIR